MLNITMCYSLILYLLLILLKIIMLMPIESIVKGFEFQNKQITSQYFCRNTSGIEGGIKIRSHAHAVTDWIYCPVRLGSPRPQAMGSKSSQLLFGRDFLILFHHFL